MAADDRRMREVVRVEGEVLIRLSDELDTASTLAAIAVFDAIAISLMGEEGFSKDEFLANHPSGDVGRRLAEGLL